MVKCSICGKEYKNIQPLSKHITSYHNLDKRSYYDKYMKQPNEGICLVCNGPTNFYGMDRGYNTYCCRRCQVIAQSNFSKVDHLDQWKTKHQLIDEFEKSNNCTHIAKLIDLYGRDWQRLNIPIIRISKMYQYVDNKYLDTIKSFKYTPISGRSHKEKSILKYINYNGKILENIKTVISPLELDLYFPELKLAVEYNGTWYHSLEAGMTKDYHLRKSIMCRNKDIRLIHIYEFEDFNIQIYKLNSLLNGIDLYNEKDFNKNNFGKIPKPTLIHTSERNYHVYGAGKLL